MLSVSLSLSLSLFKLVWWSVVAVRKWLQGSQKWSRCIRNSCGNRTGTEQAVSGVIKTVSVQDSLTGAIMSAVNIDRSTKTLNHVTLDLNHFNQLFLCFNCWKLADIQAHSATLRACRSAILERNLKMCAGLFLTRLYAWLPNLLLNPVVIKHFPCQGPPLNKLHVFGRRPPSKIISVPWDPQNICYFSIVQAYK